MYPAGLTSKNTERRRTVSHALQGPLAEQAGVVTVWMSSSLVRREAPSAAPPA